MNPCPMKVCLFVHEERKYFQEKKNYFQGHVFIKPYYTSYEYMPPLFPTGTWRLDVTLSKGPDDKVFTLNNYYEVTSKGITDF